jgi:hypothetical protein
MAIPLPDRAGWVGDLHPPRLKRDPRVVRLETVWYFTEYQITRPDDEVVSIEEFFYEFLGGKLVSNCFGAARVYTTRRAALANLAKCDLGDQEDS